MPRINLLPVKAAKRVGSARNELFVFAIVVGVCIVGLYFWYASVQMQISDMQARNDDVKNEISKIDKVVTQVDDFKKKSQVLERKLEVIDQLKKQKVGPAKMLGDLADILTKNRKVWLSNMSEHDGLLTLSGGAMEQENISEFQMALEQQSKFFTSITLTLVSSAKDGATSYFTWTLTCRTNYAAG